MGTTLKNRGFFFLFLWFWNSPDTRMIFFLVSVSVCGFTQWNTDWPIIRPGVWPLTWRWKLLEHSKWNIFTAHSLTSRTWCGTDRTQKTMSKIYGASLKFNFEPYHKGHFLGLLHFPSSCFFHIARRRAKLLRGHGGDTSGPRGEDRWVHNLLLHIWGGHMADWASGHLQ